MIERHIRQELRFALEEVPAVCLLGPRQVGKTTLALELVRETDAVYLDLESERDRARLSDAEAYFARHAGRLLVLDEIHRVPALFPVLRGVIDRGRREGLRAGRFVLLGSASMELLRQSGESLAGRIRFLELQPFTVFEPTGKPVDALWLRGGFPDSLLARSDAASMRWRRDFIRSYLERDVPLFAPRVAAETLRRFWSMLAHRQGCPLNAADLARSLGADVRTVTRYLDLLVDLLLLRRLQPWHAHAGKRLIRAPRLFLRDSGILHALLAVVDMETLLSHPIAGASWEGFCIENLIAAAPKDAEAFYYRSSGGAEIDLLLSLPGEGLWAIEVKRSSAPALSRGFHEACGTLAPTRRFVVYPGTERFPLRGDVEAISLPALTRLLRNAGA